MTWSWRSRDASRVAGNAWLSSQRGNSDFGPRCVWVPRNPHDNRLGSEAVVGNAFPLH
jgi:hypothetical protein